MGVESKNEIIESILALHKKLGRRPTKKYNSRLYMLSRKYFGSWNNMMEVAGYKIRRNQYAKLPNINDPAFYYFLGLLVTDGHMQFKWRKDKQGYESKIAIYTSYKNEVNTVCKLINYLFNYSPHIRRRRYSFNKRYNYEIIINSKSLVVYLNKVYKIPIGNKSLTLDLPILPNESLFKLNFIRGVIDGDGYVGRKRNIGISSGSLLFLNKLKVMLSDLGVSTSEPKFTGTCYAFCIYTNNFSKLYNMLYSSANYFYLRKKLSWRQILNSY